jgi:hypothetical protein
LGARTGGSGGLSPLANAAPLVWAFITWAIIRPGGRASGRSEEGTTIMPGDVAADQLRAELKEVETDLADLRRTAAEIRDGIGEADDPADRGQLIQSAAEQDALAESMEVRRRDLLSRIAEIEGTGR